MSTANVNRQRAMPLPPRLRGLLVLLAAITALLVMLAWSWWHYASERDAIAQLSDTERKAFYERTLQTLQTTCSSSSTGLAGYCAEQAELIVKFPECNDECRKLAQAYGPRPTR
jgi:cytochrome b pre-mRNA-processing protein 3